MDETIRKALLKKRITQEECYKRLGRTRDDIVDHILPDVALELEFLLDVSAEKILGCSAKALAGKREAFLKSFESKEMQDFARKFPLKELKNRGFAAGINAASISAGDTAGNFANHRANPSAGGTAGNFAGVTSGSPSPALEFPRENRPLAYHLLKFLGVSSIEGWKSYYGALQGTVNPYAYSAWIRLGELQCERPATEIVLDQVEIVKNLNFLRKNTLSLQTNLRNIVKEALEDCEIRLVEVPAFQTAPLPTAACYWCGNRPVIQFPTQKMSDTRFLEALFHAVGHILMHPKRTICLQAPQKAAIPSAMLGELGNNPATSAMLRDEGPGQNSSDPATAKTERQERQAGLFAERHLLTEAEECEIICCGRFAEKNCIQYFSRIFRVRPGIIVERLQEQKKLPGRTLLNSFKVAV